MLLSSCSPVSPDQSGNGGDGIIPTPDDKKIDVDTLNFQISLEAVLGNTLTIPSVNIKGGKIELGESITEITIIADDSVIELNTVELAEQWNAFNKDILPTGVENLKIEVANKTAPTSKPTAWFTLTAKEGYVFVSKSSADTALHEGVPSIEINTDGATVASIGDVSKGGVALKLKANDIEIPLKNEVITDITEIEMLLNAVTGYTIENITIDIASAKITANVATSYRNKIIYKGDLGLALKNDCQYISKTTPENAIVNINTESYDPKTVDAAPPTATIKATAARGYGFGNNANISTKVFDVTFAAISGCSFLNGSSLIKDEDLNANFFTDIDLDKSFIKGNEVNGLSAIINSPFLMDSKNNTAEGYIWGDEVYVSKNDIATAIRNIILPSVDYDAVGIKNNIAILNDVVYVSGNKWNGKYEVSIKLSPLDGRRFETPNSSSDPNKTIRLTIKTREDSYIIFGSEGEIGKIGNIHSRDNLVKMGFKESHDDENSRSTLVSDINSFDDLVKELEFMDNSVCTSLGDSGTGRGVLNTFYGYEDIVSQMGYTGNEDVNVNTVCQDAHPYYRTGAGRGIVVVKGRKVAAFGMGYTSKLSYLKFDLIIFDKSTGRGYVAKGVGENSYYGYRNDLNAAIIHEIDESISLANMKVYARFNHFPDNDSYQCITEVKTDGDLTLEPEPDYPKVINILTKSAYRRMGLSKNQMAGINNTESLIKALEANSTSWKQRQKNYVYSEFENFDSPNYSGMYESTDNVPLYYYLNENNKPYFSIEYGIKEMINAWGGMPLVYLGAEPSKPHKNIFHYVIVVRDDGMGYVIRNKEIKHQNSSAEGLRELIRGAYTIKDPQIYNNMNRYRTFISFTKINDLVIKNDKSIFVVKPRP